MGKKALLLILTPLLISGIGMCEPIFNVDCFFGWDNCYRPMHWTPVNVGIMLYHMDVELVHV